MNHPKGNPSIDWKLKWPEPEKLMGRTARHIGSRLFYKIQTVMADSEEVELVLETGDRFTVLVIRLEALAANYNIVPEDRL